MIDTLGEIITRNEGTRRLAGKRQVSISKRRGGGSNKRLCVGGFFFSPRKDPAWTAVDRRGNFLLEIAPVRLRREKEGIVHAARARSSDTRTPRTCTYSGPEACACRWQSTYCWNGLPFAFAISSRVGEPKHILVALRFANFNLVAEYERPRRPH